MPLGLGHRSLQVWMNRQVPPNDGGLSLGQAAMSLTSKHWP